MKKPLLLTTLIIITSCSSDDDGNRCQEIEDYYKSQIEIERNQETPNEFKIQLLIEEMNLRLDQAGC